MAIAEHTLMATMQDVHVPATNPVNGSSTTPITPARLVQVRAIPEQPVGSGTLARWATLVTWLVGPTRRTAVMCCYDTLGEPWQGRLAVPSSCRFGLRLFERAVFHLDDPRRAERVYERVIDGRPTQADAYAAYLNEAVLRRVWRLLLLAAANVRRKLGTSAS